MLRKNKIGKCWKVNLFSETIEISPEEKEIEGGRKGRGDPFSFVLPLIQV